jgi:hypothetical protein
MPEIASKEKEPILVLEILKGIKGEGADSNSRTWILSLKNGLSKANIRKWKVSRKGIKFFTSLYMHVSVLKKKLNDFWWNK